VGLCKLLVSLSGITLSGLAAALSISNNNISASKKEAVLHCHTLTCHSTKPFNDVISRQKDTKGLWYDSINDKKAIKRVGQTIHKGVKQVMQKIIGWPERIPGVLTEDEDTMTSLLLSLMLLLSFIVVVIAGK